MSRRGEGTASVTRTMMVSNDGMGREKGHEPMAIVNPGYEADMLRRAAEACRNAQKELSRADWFAWVPQHLDALADRLTDEPSSE